MISHNRLEYLQKAITSVLAQDYPVELTIWDNGSDKKTVDWLKSQDLNVIYNETNDSLAEVTTKVFSQFTSEFIGKVDSDTLVPKDWASRLIAKHKTGHYGFLGGFHFRQSELELIEPIITDDVWIKHHIGGCAYVIRRSDFTGYAGEGIMGLSEYQASVGINGYLWNPILWVEHMEDARSEHCIKTDEYQQYKLATRKLTIEQYTHGSIQYAYLMENAKLKISAVIPTNNKRPQELEEIKQHLSQYFDDIVIMEDDGKCMYNRYLANTKYDVIYTQDDDLIVDNIFDLISNYEYGYITCNTRAGSKEIYDKLYNGRIQLVGYGAIYHKDLVNFEKYFNKFPEDERFYREADRVFTWFNKKKVIVADNKMRHFPSAETGMSINSDHYTSRDEIVNRLMQCES